MTTYPNALNADVNAKATSAKYADRGDGTSDWHQYMRVADGGAATVGAKADAAVTNPALSASVVAALKGLLTLVAADTAALTALTLLEDAASANGDKGIQALTVRKNTPAATSGTDADYQPIITGTDGAVWARLMPSAFRIEVNSAGLTTVTTAYTSGDQVGTEMTFANAASSSGGGGIVIGASILDKAKVINTGDFELFLFTAASTPAADNAAADWSDANMANFVGVIKFATADWRTMASNAVNQQQGLSIGYQCSGGTSLFGALVTRQANAVFTAVTDLRVALNILRD